VSTIVAAQAQSCHMRELDLCAATLVVFTQSPSGLAVTENDLNKQCSYLKEADNCLKNFIKRCTTPIQRQMVSFMGEGSNDLLEDYCKPGTELRKAYLKHATCLNTAQNSHQKTCIKDLQVALEVMTSINADNWQKRMPIGCCSYKRFEKCIGAQVEKKCGKEAMDFINQVLKRAFSRMPDMVCRNYKPDQGECAIVLPASGTAPKGESGCIQPRVSYHIHMNCLANWIFILADRIQALNPDQSSQGCSQPTRMFKGVYALGGFHVNKVKGCDLVREFEFQSIPFFQLFQTAKQDPILMPLPVSN
jgi:hypothetical protein